MGQYFICQQSRLNKMKLFKLRTIAFSYSEHVDLYCSDKGENIILHIRSLNVHFRLYSHQKLYLDLGLRTLSCSAFAEHKLGTLQPRFELALNIRGQRSGIEFREPKTFTNCDR